MSKVNNQLMSSAVTVFTLNFSGHRACTVTNLQAHPKFCRPPFSEEEMVRKTYHKLHKLTIWPKQNICMFTVTCQKNLGSVGRD